MSEWTTQFDQHPLHDILRSATIAAQTELAQKTERDPDTTERLARIDHVLADVSARIGSMDPDLIPLQPLTDLAQPIQRISDALAGYQSNRDPSQVAAAHNELENVLVHLNKIPALRTSADVEGVREAVTALRRSMGQNLRQLDTQSAGVRQALDVLDGQLRTVEARMAETQERLETRVGEAEQRLATAEAQRSAAFDEAQADRARQAQELHASKSNEWETALATERDGIAQVIAESKSVLDANQNELKSAANTLLKDIDTLKLEAQNLVGIIAETGLIGGYQKEADRAQRAGTIWRVTAAASLGVLVVFALFVFMTHVGQKGQTTWADVGWRVFVASAVGLLAAYAARQADKHDRTRRRNRRMELELASISPYLTELPEAHQVELKSELARRLFGQHDAGESKDESSTTGTQTDVAKLIIESLQSFVSRQ